MSKHAAVLSALMAVLVGSSALAEEQGFITTGKAGPQPLETLVIGDLTYEQVKLTSAKNHIVQFSHALGNKTVPLVALTREQVDALNTTNDKVKINPGKVDLTPPSAEAARRAVELIQQAGDVDGLLPDGKTPLIEAASRGETEVVKALIVRDADVNLRTASDETAVSAAAAGRFAGVLRVLRDAGARSPDLMAAVLSGDVQTVREQISKNRDLLKAVDKEGMTPLMRAAAEDQTEVIAELLKLGASTSETGMTPGRTPLMVAAAAGRQAAAQSLISRGASLNAQDEAGWTPLMHAADAGHAETVRLLLSKGANFKLADKSGQTPLMRAQIQNRLAVEEAIQTHAARLSAPAPTPPTTVQVPATASTATSPVQRTAAPKPVATAPPPTAAKQSAAVVEKLKAASASAPAATEAEEEKPKPPRTLVLLVFGALFLAGIGHIWLMVVGYQQSPFWTVGMFLLDPIVGFFFTIMHPREGWLPFSIHLTGFLIFYGIPGLYGMSPMNFMTS